MFIARIAFRALLAAQHAGLWLAERLTARAQQNGASPRRILLLRTAALGDFIFAIPAMTALRRQHPDARIVLLTATTTDLNHQSTVQNYAGRNTLPWLTFVVPSVVNEAITIRSFGLKSLWTEIRVQVRALNPDAVVIFAHPGEPGFALLKKILLLRLLGARCRIYGWRTRASNKWLKRTQHKAGLFEHHVIAPLRSIAEIPGMPAAESMAIEFPLHGDATAVAWTEELWRERNWSGKQVVAVAPGSIQPHKRWPIARFVELCRTLVERHKVVIVIIGTSLDRLLGDHIAERVGAEVVNLTGETSLFQSAALLERCALLVGNDGGAMHLGSAVRCPTVSIVSGIEYPDSIEPWYSRTLAVRHPVPCAPCYSFTHCPRGHNQCLDELPLMDVLSRCMTVLDLDNTQATGCATSDSAKTIAK